MGKSIRALVCKGLFVCGALMLYNDAELFRPESIRRIGTGNDNQIRSERLIMIP